MRCASKRVRLLERTRAAFLHIQLRHLPDNSLNGGYKYRLVVKGVTGENY
jgi:hypothetical protein